MPKQKSKRGGVSKDDGKYVGIWFDPIQIKQVDLAATSNDLNRSQFIRAAVKRALANIPR